jgi:tetratricopeptide (TPR) repeat protein
MFAGEFEAGIQAANEVLPLAERLDLEEERVRLLNLRGDARVAIGDEGGFDDLELSVVLAAEAQVYEHLHSALNNLMARQVALARLDAARETLAAMRLNFERHPSDSERRWLLSVEAEAHYTDGNWREAMPLLEGLIAESEAGTPHYLDPVNLTLRATIRRALGDLEGASADSAKALDHARRSAEPQLLGLALTTRAAVLILYGREAEASELAREALGLDRQLILNDLGIVDAAWVMHDLGLADGYAAWLPRRGGVPWAQAAAAVCSDDFVRAAALLEQIRYVPGEAYARLRAAEQLVSAGRRAEADDQLHRSLAFWREVGATPYVREGETLLAASA